MLPVIRDCQSVQHYENSSRKGKKLPSVTIDPSLDKLEEETLFPEKLAKANEMLKTANLPYKKHQPK